MLQNLPSLRSIRLMLLIVFVNGFLIFPSIAQVTRNSQILEKRITISIGKMTLKDALDKIAKTASVAVIYSNSKELTNTSVSVSVSNKLLKEVLNDLLAPYPLSYRVIDDKIVVSHDGTKMILHGDQNNPKRGKSISGKITDSKGDPLHGATVAIKGGIAITTSDNNGNFALRDIPVNAIIVVTFIGYQTKQITFSRDSDFFAISLEDENEKLSEVRVVSTGYQTISNERATGSFTIVDNTTLNRAVSSDLLSRLKGVTNGLLIDNRTGNPNGISIRGRSTLFSNTEPLIVIDNFPFDGDINTINPNDVETVTLLKDAAAASIWGVRAGNGVIVITTKRGRANQQPTISFNANLTIGAKPNLKYQPQLDSGDFIDIEKYLFNQGWYYQLYDDYDNISPVVAILQQQKLGQLSAAQTNQQIDALRNIDDRDQQSQYFYRKSSNQQYHLDISGGSQNQTYYFSGGYDYNLPNAVGTSNSRITLKGNNTYSLLNNKLKLTTDITFTKSQQTNNNGYGYVPLYPYEQVADAEGNPLAVVSPNNYALRPAYTDTAGHGKLLDWKYRPLDELRNQNSINKSSVTDYRILLGLNYKIIKSLSASINYQYYSSNQKSDIDYNQQSFYVRNLINTTSTINTATGVVTRPIPIGDIYSPLFINSQSNYGRAQLNFNQTFGLKHEVNAIGGFEVRDDQYQTNSTTLYGYFPSTETSALVNNTATYPSYFGPGAIPTTIGNTNFLSSTTNRYISFYSNASYTYNQRYVVSGSYRKDESNLFGVSANQKGVPLWSTGLAWNVEKEDFFNIGWLSTLQLKTTYGYNGNVNQNVSAYLTANAAGVNPKYSNVNYAKIVNPPNDGLRWERVKNINFGLNFSTKNSRITGSLEYYIKNGIDLIGTSPISPQEGVTTFTGNSADTHTSGIDVQFNTININGSFKWMTAAIFNHVVDKVIAYKQPRGTNANLIGSVSLTPLEGYPINSIFGFKWNGLDKTGGPQGVLNGSLSENYASIINSTNTIDLDFFGSAVPTTFGNIRNTFSYKNIEISFNISYKLNYYFRRNSINYSYLINGNFQQADYDLRWQKAGDELATNVPSFVYPANANRDELYQYSSILVDRGDQIRLQDINLNYTLTKAVIKDLPFSSLNIYLYANNIGILWRANKDHIDPDILSGYPSPSTIAFGLRANF